MTVSRMLVAAILTSTVISPTAAQTTRDIVQTPSGPCRVLAMIPGGSNRGDQGFSLCAVDRRPTLSPNMPLPPAPRFATFGGVRLAILVKEDGTVDSTFTRTWTVSMQGSGMDYEFNNGVMETVRKWRFAPGMRDGKPVRVGINLDVTMKAGPDTTPARLIWTYVAGTEGDTLRGEWEPLPPLPPFAEAVVDSMLFGILDILAKKQVFSGPAYYCIVAVGGSRDLIPVLGSKLQQLANDSDSIPVVATHVRDCVTVAGTRRLIFSKPYRLDEDRAVFRVEGDVFKNWPPGRESKDWLAWTARCVSAVTNAQRVATCAVEPKWEIQNPRLPMHWRGYGRAGTPQ